MPRKRQDVTKATYDLRAAITELIHWMQVWMKRKKSCEAQISTMLQALWLINLAGVENSGVPRGTSSKVLLLMREVALGRTRPLRALDTMRRWERG